MLNEWREHPKLKGRFLPDHPDDLQVFVHDGGPRITKNPAEAVWVTLTEMHGEVFQGCVLNQPHNLRSVRKGSPIKFVVADGAEFPVMVTDKYLREREAWVIHSCSKCGLSELFDAPSDLIRVVFPNQPAGGEMSVFTAFCPLCGGVQGVESRGNPMSGKGNSLIKSTSCHASGAVPAPESRVETRITAEPAPIHPLPALLDKPEDPWDFLLRTWWGLLLMAALFSFCAWAVFDGITKFEAGGKSGRVPWFVALAYYIGGKTPAVLIFGVLAVICAFWGVAKLIGSRSDNDRNSGRTN